MKYKLRKKKNKEITGYYGYWDSKKKKRVFEALWQEKN
jgi:ribosomal protein L20